MKTLYIIPMLAVAIITAGAQTNTPSPIVTAPVKILTPSSLPPVLDAAPVSASLKTNPQSSTTPSSMTKLPVLIIEDSEIIRTKSGTEYRGLLARAPRPVGGKFNPLQLINPFAPMSYGIAGASSTRPAPRAFQDERTHEPTGFTVISVSR